MSDFAWRTILVIEDEPLVALDISETFQVANARVEVAPTCTAARHGMQAGVVAAILDLGLHDGNGQALCDELKSRSIPFVVYSGYPCPATLEAPYIPKPSNARMLVEVVEGLLERPATRPPRRSAAARGPSAGRRDGAEGVGSFP